jgi:universal stress protein E
MIASENPMSRAFEAVHHGPTPFGAQQRRVLCAIDLSRRSERALKAAAVLANRLGAQLTLLHVVSAHQPKRTAGLAQEVLRVQLSASGLRLGSVPVVAVREGDVARMVAKVARESGAQLIVMGAQRKRALAPILGTTAERVVALAQCPVLIIRSKGTSSYHRVVIAAELNPSFKEVVRFADQWSFLDAPTLSIVHGFTSPYQGPLYAEGYDVAAARRHIGRWKRFARTHLQDMLGAAGVDGSKFDVRIEERRPLRVVRRALRNGAPSLLILGTSAPNALTRIVRGSLVNDALLSLECDVLICPRNVRGQTVH